MANLDLTPLYRSSVGYDQLPGMLQSAMKVADSDLGYPPYNIERTGEDTYRIVVSLAGYSHDDVDIVVEQNRMTISGKMPQDDGVQYLHRGIAGRSFKRNFDLADYIEVKGATFENGLLIVELKREIPDRLKPRRIEIAGDKQNGATKKTTKKAA